MIRLLLPLLLLTTCTLAAQTGTITGRVVDENGQPLYRATIRVMGAPRGGFSSTDGSFRIANVPVGVWDIKISFAGKIDQVRRHVRVGLDQVVDLGTVTLGSKPDRGCCLCPPPGPDRNPQDHAERGTVRVYSGEWLRMTGW